MLASLNTAVSGMNAARASLAVIGHNMANVDTPGYTRQRIIQHEFISQTIGMNNGTPQQVGLGTDYSGIQQIRNKFFDISYREEVGKAAFYNVKATAGRELQAILGELQSDFQTQNVLTDLWTSISELMTYQPGIDTRGNFVSMCMTFLEKANNVHGRLVDYQLNLNEQIIKSVQEINTLVTSIHNLNTKIMAAEVSGDRANDYRDQLNVALDKLSAMADVNIRYDNRGQISLTLDGNILLSNGSINRIGLKYSASGSPMVEPVFTSSNSILPYNAPKNSYIPLFSLTNDVNSINGDDKGLLKGLLVARGYNQCNYASPQWPDPYSLDSNGNPLYNFRPPIGPRPEPYDPVTDEWYIDPKTGPTAEQLVRFRTNPYFMEQYDKNKFDAEYSVIAKAMRDFDILFHSVITMINDMVAPPTNISDPDAPYNLKGEQSFFEIFVRNHVPRYDADGNYIPENPYDSSTLYSIGNIHINPRLHSAAGYTEIALSKNGDLENNDIALDMLAKWKEAFIDVPGQKHKLSVNDFYAKFITDIATKTNESIGEASKQDILVQANENKRFAMSAVSLDEEMEFMMKYQHAYNAAARIVNVIDEMLDRIMNLKR